MFVKELLYYFAQRYSFVRFNPSKLARLLIEHESDAAKTRED